MSDAPETHDTHATSRDAAFLIASVEEEEKREDHSHRIAHDEEEKKDPVEFERHGDEHESKVNHNDAETKQDTDDNDHGESKMLELLEQTPMKARRGEHNSAIAQMIEKAFYVSLTFDRKTEFREYPLEDSVFVALAKGDEISLDMLLGSASSESSVRSMRKRDSAGRSIFHIASLSKSVDVLQYLINYQRNFFSKDSISKLATLEREREECLNNLLRSGDLLRSDMDVINEWFESEKKVCLRRTEFQCEEWSFQLLRAKDYMGRTALHYLASVGAPASMVRSLFNESGGNFSRNRRDAATIRNRTSGSPQRLKPRKHNKNTGLSWTTDILSTGHGVGDSMEMDELYSTGCMFDLITGREAAVIASNTYDIPTVTTTALTLGLDGSGPSSLSPGNDLLNGRYDDTDNETKGGTLGAKSSLLLRSGGWTDTAIESMRDPSPPVDYEIVVPWVCRGMLKQIVALKEHKEAQRRVKGSESKNDIELDVDHDSKHETHSGTKDSPFETLSMHLEELDFLHTGVLLFPFFKDALTSLGIRVTNDILVELCRRYSPPEDEIEKCFREYVANIPQDSRHVADAKESRDNKHTNGHEDGKSSFKESAKVSTTGSKHSAGEDFDDYTADSKHNESHASSSKRGGLDDDDFEDVKGSVSAPKPKKLTPKQRMLKLISTEDFITNDLNSNVGLNIEKFVADLRSGRGTQSLYLSSEKTKAKEQAVADEFMKKAAMEAAATRLGIAHDMLADLVDLASKHAGGSPGRSRENSVELPRFATVPMLRMRRKKLLEIRDAFDRTPLMIAAALGNTELVEEFLKLGADITATTESKQSVLSMASGADCRALVQDSLVAWLNESKYSLRPRVNLRAAKSLHASFGSSDGSIEYDHPKLTASLDRYTFKPRKRIDAEEKNAQMEQLIEQLPTLNEKSLGSGKSGLSWAISSGYSHCVLKLLREGADPNKCDKSGRFPLHDCALLLRASTAIDDMSAVLNIAEGLLRHGAKVDAVSVSGRTAMHELFCRTQDDPIASYVHIHGSKKGFTVTTHNSEHESAAIRVCRKKLLQQFLAWGADPSVHDRRGLTAVHYCVRENLPECLLEFLKGRSIENMKKNGSNSEATDCGAILSAQGQTLMHTACKHGAEACANMLAKWHADSIVNTAAIDICDRSGKKAMQYMHPKMQTRCLDTLWHACRHGEVTTVSNLLVEIRRKSSDRFAEDVEIGMMIALGRSHEVKKLTDGSDGDAENTSGNAEDGKDTLGMHNSPRKPVLEEWLRLDVSARTRQLRWTCVHVCVVGWAEYSCGLRVKSTAEQAAIIAAASATSSSSSPSYSSPTKSSSRYRANPKAQRREAAAFKPKSDIMLLSVGRKEKSSGAGINKSALRALRLPPSPGDIRSSREDMKLPTPKIEASSAGFQYLPTLSLLLKTVTFVDSIDINGRTPLMLAAMCGLTDACELLVEAHCDVNASDLDGNTACHLAYAYGATSVAMYLEGRPDFLESTNAMGNTPLDCAGSFKKIRPVFATC